MTIQGKYVCWSCGTLVKEKELRRVAPPKSTKEDVRASKFWVCATCADKYQKQGWVI